MSFNLLLTVGWILFAFLLFSLFETEYKKQLQAIGIGITGIGLIVYAPYTWVVDQSLVQACLSFITGSMCLYVSVLVYFRNIDIRRIILMIVSSTGILLIVYTFAPVRDFLIGTVSSDTIYILTQFGFDVSKDASGDHYSIVFNETEKELKTNIVIACTGIGSMALFIGLISTFQSLSLKIKSMLMIISVSIIYLLNLIRNVFIAAAYGGQWFHIQPELIGMIFGRSDEWVSFYIADKILAQTGSIIFLLLFVYILFKYIHNKNIDIKILDEIFTILSNLESDLKN